MIVYVSGGSSGVVTDPYWGDVILFLNGSGTVTTDSSSFNRTLSSTGTPTLDAGNPLFGLSTYLIDAGADRISIASDAFVAVEIGSSEWCLEIQATPAGTGGNTYSAFSRFTLGWNSGTENFFATCAGLSGSSYALEGATGSAVAGVRASIAFVRDKSNASFDYLKLYQDGVLIDTSPPITKSFALDLGAGFGWILGYSNTSLLGSYAQYRVTKNHARYYSDYTPQTAAFPTS